MSNGLALKGSLDLIAAVLDAKDEAHLFKNMEAATKKCGFEMFLIGLETRSVDGVRVHHVTSGYPDPWKKAYAENNYVLQDPTVAYCQTHRDPVVWSERLFTSANSLRVWEEAREFGIGFGISVPTHERTSTKSMVSLVRDKDWGNDPREHAELMAAAKILASCAHIATGILIQPVASPFKVPSLTPQEKICLRWAAQGKTSWEIGKIMNISTPTVVFHLKNVMKKLDVVNRSQALVVAFRMGLID